MTIAEGHWDRPVTDIGRSQSTNTNPKALQLAARLIARVETAFPRSGEPLVQAGGGR